MCSRPATRRRRHGKSGRYAEAEALYRDATADCERVHGRDAELTMTLRGNYATVLAHQGKPAQVEKLFRSTVADLRRTLGPQSDTTLNVSKNLAAVLDPLGRHEEARELLSKVVTQYERIPARTGRWATQ